MPVQPPKMTSDSMNGKRVCKRCGRDHSNDMFSCGVASVMFMVEMEV